jgi:hypothetical protein
VSEDDIKTEEFGDYQLNENAHQRDQPNRQPLLRL